jgi:hypothetical protein
VGAFGDGRDRSARLHRAHVARAEDHAH